MKKQADSAEGQKAADDLKEFEVKRIKVRLRDGSVLALHPCKRLSNNA